MCSCYPAYEDCRYCSSNETPRVDDKSGYTGSAVKDSFMGENGGVYVFY